MEYITAALRTTVSEEDAIYGSKRIWFPIPKLYVTNVGIVEKDIHLAQSVQYDMKLSDSFLGSDEVSKAGITPDLELIVHVFDFRMTFSEVHDYVFDNLIPQRFSKYKTDLLDYGLFCNALNYTQITLKHNKRLHQKRMGLLELPNNIKNEADLLELLRTRGIFYDLLSNKEVCDLTIAQFSREDIIKYQGIEQGIEQGVEIGREENYRKLITNVCKKIQKGRSLEDICEALEETYEVILPIYNLVIKYKDDEINVDDILKELKNNVND